MSGSAKMWSQGHEEHSLSMSASQSRKCGLPIAIGEEVCPMATSLLRRSLSLPSLTCREGPNYGPYSGSVVEEDLNDLTTSHPNQAFLVINDSDEVVAANQAAKVLLNNRKLVGSTLDEVFPLDGCAKWKLQEVDQERTSKEGLELSQRCSQMLRMSAGSTSLISIRMETLACMKRRLVLLEDDIQCFTLKVVTNASDRAIIRWRRMRSTTSTSAAFTTTGFHQTQKGVKSLALLGDARHIHDLLPNYPEDNLEGSRAFDWSPWKWTIWIPGALPAVFRRRLDHEGFGYEEVEITAFQTCKGMVLVDDSLFNARVQEVDELFSLLALGMPRTEVIGKPISEFIPEFTGHSDKTSLSDEVEEGECFGDLVAGVKAMKVVDENKENSRVCLTKSTPSKKSPLNAQLSSPSPWKKSFRTERVSPLRESIASQQVAVTSTPMRNAKPSVGHHHCLPHSTKRWFASITYPIGRSSIPICYETAKVVINGETMVLLWVSVAPHSDDAAPNASKTFEDTFNDEDDPKKGNISSCARELSFGQEIQSVACRGAVGSQIGQSSQCPRQSALLDSLVHELSVESAPFHRQYGLLGQIAKGSFGRVFKAYHRKNRGLVVVKLIEKARLPMESWRVTDMGEILPVEVDILRRLRSLQHPGIVVLLEDFECLRSFQLVMERHGCGMDLFEYIERRHIIQEDVSSFIFRQVAAAVAFLHSRGILHRDIKDENVILDERFGIKLIDFGSAVFFPSTESDDGKFATFFGTLEYCSPEVLSGERYRGPEMEVWALGMLLHVLSFGRKPFREVWHAVGTPYIPPPEASENLADLLAGTLKRDPDERFTVNSILDHSWTNLSNGARHKLIDHIRCDPSEIYCPNFYKGEDSSLDLSCSLIE